MTQPSIAKRIIPPDIGERFLGQAQRLGCVDRGCRRGLAIGQPVQNVEDVGLGSNARLKRQFARAKHGLFVVLQDERQDLGHLSIAAGATQELALQLLERIGQLRERRAVPQRPRLALDHRQIILC